jgi:hypothetical protein
MAQEKLQCSVRKASFDADWPGAACFADPVDGTLGDNGAVAPKPTCRSRVLRNVLFAFPAFSPDPRLPDQKVQTFGGSQLESITPVEVEESFDQ